MPLYPHDMKTIHELMNLKERVALVAGGSGQVGSVACETLAELGANVIILDLEGRNPQATVQAISERHHVRAEGFPVDLSPMNKRFALFLN